jgi:hypothetical protein
MKTNENEKGNYSFGGPRVSTQLTDSLVLVIYLQYMEYGVQAVPSCSLDNFLLEMNVGMSRQIHSPDRDSLVDLGNF